MKHLLLIRHGESEADLLDVHEGRADFPLTERGRRQAAAMSRYVADHHQLHHIFASTLRRASETARLLGEAAKTPVVPYEDLMEFNNGLLAGLPRREAAEKYPMIPDLPVDKSAYGMESIRDFRARAERALVQILALTPDGTTTAVVSHGGMIDQLFKSLLALPVDTTARFLSGDTAIHYWRIGEKGNALVCANRQEHLGDI